MLELTSEASYTIKDRGVCYAVDLGDFVQHTDPRTLLGSEVMIDDTQYTVRGVEAFCVPWAPGKLRKVGLLV